MRRSVRLMALAALVSILAACSGFGEIVVRRSQTLAAKRAAEEAALVPASAPPSVLAPHTTSPL